MDVPTVAVQTGTGQERHSLAEKLSRAWTQFARSGNPSHPGIPRWEPYSPAHRAVMIIDNDWHLDLAPHAAEHAAIAELMAKGRKAGPA
jgi:para-nitrobenzyl esterase